MTEPLEALDPELSALLTAEAELLAVTPERHGRIWRGVDAAIVPTPGGGGGSDGGPSAGPSPIGPWLSHGLVGVVTLAIGGFLGAYLHAATTRPPTLAPAPFTPPAEPLTEEPDLADPAPTTLEEESEPMEEVATEPDPPPPVRAIRAAPRPRAETLAAERAIIDVARGAVTRGHPADALDAVRRHAREFPRGRLIEEREALRIIALARSGRTEAAQERADVFRERFPRSILWPSVQAVLP